MEQCIPPLFENQDIYCGIDVHKKDWVICVLHDGRQVAHFRTDANAQQVAIKLKKDYPGARIHSAYEAGFSGFEAHRILLQHGIDNIVVNAADIPTSGKERDFKNDHMDCKKIARCHYSNLLTPIYIPSREQLKLRNLVRREKQLVSARARIKNQLKGFLHFQGQEVPPKEPGKKRLQKLYMEAKANDDHCLMSLLLQLDSYSKQLLQVRKWEMATLQKTDKIETFQHITSIPGIGPRTGLSLLSEIWDINRFPNNNHLAAYVGFAPRLVGSGEKEKTISSGYRRQKHLQYLLIEAAWTSMRHDKYLMALSGKLRGKHFSNQKIASVIGKKLLFMVKAVWVEGREYQPDMPPQKQNKKIKTPINQQ
jgi:transposase